MTREEHILREWLSAIRLEINARGRYADLATISSYAEQALAGEVPHWYTDEYRAKVRAP